VEEEVTAAFGRIGYISVNIFTILRVSYLENRGFLPDKGRNFSFLSIRYQGVVGAFTLPSNASSA